MEPAEEPALSDRESFRLISKFGNFWHRISGFSKEDDRCIGGQVLVKVQIHRRGVGRKPFLTVQADFER